MLAARHTCDALGNSKSRSLRIRTPATRAPNPTHLLVHPKARRQLATHKAQQNQVSKQANLLVQQNQASPQSRVRHLRATHRAPSNYLHLQAIPHLTQIPIRHRRPAALSPIARPRRMEPPATWARAVACVVVTPATMGVTPASILRATM